jgi:hypothetical protein
MTPLLSRLRVAGPICVAVLAAATPSLAHATGEAAAAPAEEGLHVALGLGVAYSAVELSAGSDTTIDGFAPAFLGELGYHWGGLTAGIFVRPAATLGPRLSVDGPDPETRNLRLFEMPFGVFVNFHPGGGWFVQPRIGGSYASVHDDAEVVSGFGFGFHAGFSIEAIGPR